MPQFNTEAFLTAQRKNIEACTALSQAVSESFQSLWRRQGEAVRQMMEEASQTVNAIMSCPTPEDKVIRQAEAGKVAVEKCLANVRDIAETVAKCNNQALETVNTRMNEGLDELRCIVKSRSHAA
ncbi:MAG: phasin family protein [Alphaproteobacteria bacterium]|nr:phasin family protein [Alphaproteobacteria bacterium]